MLGKKKDESVQELIGFERFTQYGVMVRKHELLYFIVQPCNISVMSPENVSLKIIALTNILTAFPELQLSCTDANECFDSNKIHIRHLAEKERISSVRRQLELDSEELDHMQSETATARQFTFVYPAPRRHYRHQADARPVFQYGDERRRGARCRRRTAF